MDYKAIWSTMIAKLGREAEAEAFLLRSLEMVREEPGTTRFVALRLEDRTFAIFDTFADPAAFEAHITGPLRAFVDEQAKDLFEGPPTITEGEILGLK